MSTPITAQMVNELRGATGAVRDGTKVRVAAGSAGAAASATPGASAAR